MAFLLHLIVVLASLFCSPATAYPLFFLNGTEGKFISNGIYSSNLDYLFSSLSSNTSAASGSATTTIGRAPDRVYGLTFCRGDADAASCHSCIQTAVSDIKLLSPNSKGVIIWYDDCQLRYSSQDFLRAPDVALDIRLFMFNFHNVSADQLSRSEILTTALIGNLSDLAVRNASRLFATGETILAANSTIYGLVQCARQLSVGDCRTCLQGTVNATTNHFLKGKMGGRALGTWCTMRFEFYKFYNGSSMLFLSSDQTPSSPSPLSPPSPSSPPSPLSPLSPTQNSTNSLVTPSNGGSSTVDIVLVISISVVAALVGIA